ncbi:type II secretion system protein, partial [Escherichia coli]|uniref:type II secretion system protein n=1 Tax=Escherichia coli TaxID=562 RepID=UPI0003BB1857
MIKKKGFTLLEVTIVLGIGTLIAFMKFQDMRNDQEAVLADNVGTQIKQLGEAVNRYISIRYDKISTLSSSNNQSSDPGPRTCSAAGCEITYQTLINEGLLPAGYTGTNAQKASYKIVLKRSGTAPNYVINGLITTASPWEEGGRIRYDLLGKAVQAAGVDGGMALLNKSDFG